MNIAFEYLYRDAANYKNWGEVVFTTDSNAELREIDSRIRNALIDGQNFMAEDLNLPTLYFASRDKSTDHGWHEYSAVSWTEAASSNAVSIEVLITRLTASRKNSAIDATVA